MTDLRKAAEQASTDLEELIHWHGVRDSNDKLMPAHNQTPEIKSAIESLDALRQALAQPKQEPMAWVFNRELFWPSEYEIISEDGDNAIPLYTAPPKREWVGITKEDKKEILEMTQPNERGYVIAITEAKLKEKNS